MDHLRNSIKLYFSTFSLDKVFKENADLSVLKNTSSSFSDHSVGINDFDYRTEDEVTNLYSKLDEDWFKQPGKQYGNNKKSIFHLLNHFNEQVLTEFETHPVVKYEHLLKWRDLSYALGEDVFTTSYFAYRDLQSKKKRGYFSWKSTITTDNTRLRQLLQSGVAENHAHFAATGPTFELSWIVLMNRYNEPFVKKGISDLVRGGRLSPKLNKGYIHDDSNLFEIIKEAIMLRFELLRQYKKAETGEEIFINSSSQLEQGNSTSATFHHYDTSLYFEEYWDNINAYKNHSSPTYYHNGQQNFIDYAIPLTLHKENDKGCYYFAGERILLYKSFYYLFENGGQNGLDTSHFSIILHKYLLIKNIIRREIIQLNQRLGFGNFKKYQDRKGFFLETGSIYENIFVHHVLSQKVKDTNMLSQELRMGPKEKDHELKDTIKNILKVENKLVLNDENLCDISENTLIFLTEKENLEGDLESNSSISSFFTLHFFKKKDTKVSDQNKNTHTCKNHKLRGEVKKQARKIINFRSKYPKFAKYIRGIDAASSEINARPEVFAQAFRMLKNHQLRDNETLLKNYVVNNPLNITFHAGEDFFDIVDGLRYIDECLTFLGMQNGDRLGHAIALGIDVQKYYALKKHKLLISKHTLLDNLSWTLSTIHKFGMKDHLSEAYRLENLFKALYSEVYIANIQRNKKSKELISHISHHEYHDAWMLRGDNPETYLEFCSGNKHSNCIDFFANQINNTYWERCQLNNCNPKLNGLRNREELVRLYYEYHYNYDVKVKGEEIKQFEITIPYQKLIHDIQVKMMEQIANKNIMIETNPTSNFLIGPIEKYIDHPITRWYNLGLETDPELIKACPQLCVSINTDDAGIFSTSLENEYALMAIALEKEKDEHGNPKYKPSMIYDWLDRVRQMGIQQSFINR